MKLTVTLARILTGALFIFSGLVKAIDPLGLAYKMQEFFEAWADSGILKSLMHTLNDHALAFSIVMITLEVAVGVALLLGWQKRITTIVLFLLMLFFTFLTSYVLFSGKIRACGCFGDCIPLTPIQTFAKDIVLLLLSILLLVCRKYIHPVLKPLANTLVVMVAIVLTIFLQLHVLKHLPVKDCLPYKEGNNLLELRKMPKDAVQDQFTYTFVYEKDGAKKDFVPPVFPDSSWTFKERKQVLVKKGKNNVPLINDFSLTNDSGQDVTDSVLNLSSYYLLFMKEVPSNANDWMQTFKGISKKGKAIYVVTAQRTATEDFLKQHSITVTGILTADGTAIKTAARVNPTLFSMQGPVVLQKRSWADMDEIK